MALEGVIHQLLLGASLGTSLRCLHNKVVWLLKQQYSRDWLCFVVHISARGR